MIADISWENKDEQHIRPGRPGLLAWCLVLVLLAGMLAPLGAAAQVNPFPQPSPGPTASPLTPGTSPPPSPGAAAPPVPGASPAAGLAADTVELEGDYFRYERDPDVLRVQGHVVARSKEFQLTAEELVVDNKRKLVIAESPFVLRLFGEDRNKEQLLTGQKLVYNYDTRKAVVDNGFMEVPADNPDQVMFIHADRIISLNRRKYLVSNAHMTTCYYQEVGRKPHYETEVGFVEYVPGDRIVAWGSSFYLNRLFLVWIPVWFINLRERGQGVEFGNNTVEGNFAKTRFPYTISDQHRGWVYNNVMEKKGYGLGFEHSWRPANGQSVSSASFYGLPINQFTDRQWRFFHDQRFSKSTGVTLDYADTNIYNFSAILSPRRNDSRFSGKIEDVRTFTLFGESDLSSRWSLGTDYLNQENVDLNGRTNSVTDQTNSNFRWDVNVEKTSFNLSSAWSINKQRSLAFTPGAQDSVTLSETWNNNLTFNQEIAPSLTMTSNLRQFTSSSKNNQAPNPGVTATSLAQRTLQSTTTLSQDLKFASLSLNLDKSWDLSRAYDLPRELQAFRNRGVRDVLPELTIQGQTIWEKGIPFNISAQFGHFFESQTLTDTTRALYRWSLGGKDYSLEGIEGWQDLPLLGTAKLNFNGTRFEQYFYGTQDQQFFFNGEANLQLGPEEALANFHFVRGVTSIRNNSPFAFDRLGLSKRKEFTGSLNLGNVPEGTLQIQGGYDYSSRTYNPLVFNFRSDIGKYFSINIQDTYNIRRDQPDLNLGGGNWSPLAINMGINSSERPYGGLYGGDDIPWGWQLNTQLQYNWQRASWDALLNRIYLVTGGSWVTHWEVVIQAGYDLRDRVYRVNQIYVNKDLHDFVLSFSFDRFLSQFLFSLQMVAFPSVSTQQAQTTLNQTLSGSPLGR